MKKRMLRDIEVSEVRMGCMAFSHGYGQIPPETYSIEAIRNAYEHGCTFFDTAEVYSPNLSGTGHNEDSARMCRVFFFYALNPVIILQKKPDRTGETSAF